MYVDVFAVVAELKRDGSVKFFFLFFFKMVKQSPLVARI